MKAEKKCGTCGSLLFSTHSSKRYCGPDCYPSKIGKPWTGKYKRTYRTWSCVCSVCEKLYEARSHNSKYCPECRSGQYKSSLETKMRDRFAILARDNFSCVYCGRNPTKHKAVLHVDHIIPKSKGGKDEAGNLIAACERCNLSKAAASTTTTSLFLAVAEERCKEIGISITLKVKI